MFPEQSGKRRILGTRPTSKKGESKQPESRNPMDHRQDNSGMIPKGVIQYPT
ncbi:hypothetical protein ASZ90_008269 [hydrocarbon metagenome]|uniref:Uncharacterized protein n=1 Tax=hydrocarbon metagenome TaxID=938273 RepID=A0A0W8FM74_9ZZZZ